MVTERHLLEMTSEMKTKMKPLFSLITICLVALAGTHARAENEAGISKAQGFISSLAKNPAYDIAIHNDNSWPTLLDQDSYVLELLKEASTTAYVQKIKSHTTLEFLFSEPSGVSEGYSIGEHTARVLALLEDQSGPYQVSQIPTGSEIRDYHHLLKYTLAFHDIGKSIAYRSGDKSRETVFSDPLAFDLLTIAGFNASEVRLGVALISAHQIIGNYLRGEIYLEDVLTEIQNSAALAQTDEPTFFRLLEVIYVCDAGSYPYLYSLVFQRNKMGRLVPKASEYQVLRKHYVTNEN